MRTFVQLNESNRIVAILQTGDSSPVPTSLIQVVGPRAKRLELGDLWSRLPAADVMPAEE